ncbi:FHA domain-containing protein [Comamonas serinivorans]|uniref:FHA domain-containing protein n=1 Tax=Comamonas serinivorans TaxID=1082851 RepID=A0A1Y0ESH9_9BURK|nr:FHA domain-containing protein [Comamonas serinivorans]ARU06536.1 FHA domain-containing protein [Comamonas serinivorans]
MPKIVVLIDGVTIKEMQLTKDRTTVGRRPYNDVVIDNLAVSGEHAVFRLASGIVSVEDLGSTNGVYVNGQAVTSSVLRDSDVVEIGRYQVRLIDDANPAGDKPFTRYPASESGVEQQNALLRVLTGASAGREMPLTKVVSTFGKPGVVVGSITRSRRGWELTHVEGKPRCTVNGVPLEPDGVLLKQGDTIGLAGIKLEFVLT